MVWSRMTETDLAAACACPVDIVNVSIAVSDLQIATKLRRDRGWVLATVDRFVRTARDAGVDVSVGGEDASRAEPDFVLRVAEAAQAAGARRFRFADTLGVLDPFTTFSRIAHLSGHATSKSRCTPTTTSAWRPPTRWPRCWPARRMSIPRSTALASAPAMQRWKRWWWR